MQLGIASSSQPTCCYWKTHSNIYQWITNENDYILHFESNGCICADLRCSTQADHAIIDRGLAASATWRPGGPDKEPCERAAIGRDTLSLTKELSSKSTNLHSIHTVVLLLWN